VLIVRSYKPFFKSKPGKYLLTATLLVVGVTLIFPFTSLGRVFGFSPLPLSFVLAMGGIVVSYIFAAEMTKKVFYKRVKR
jgi:Mg2+-importing ATPase